MDVLVCATQVPFRPRGAPCALEELVGDLVGALEGAGHRAEAVLVPAADDPSRLLDAAVAWRMVPLDAEAVVALDFPAYFARHPRKVTWLADADGRVADQRAADGDRDGDGDGDGCIEDLRQMLDWDIRALSEARARFSVSDVAADRLRRHCGLSVTRLPAPPPLVDRLGPRDRGPGSYVLHVARPGVDDRVGLFLAGLASSTRSVPAVVACLGRSPGQVPAAIERLDLGDRVHVPRSVSASTLGDLFAHAIAVIHTPSGPADATVALQAFRCGVPVITSWDCPAVLEWVTHEVTGLVTDGTAVAVGSAVDRLAADPALAASLGAAGRARAADLTWDRVVSTLTSAAQR